MAMQCIRAKSTPLHIYIYILSQFDGNGTQPNQTIRNGNQNNPINNEHTRINIISQNGNDCDIKMGGKTVVKATREAMVGLIHAIARTYTLN